MSIGIRGCGNTKGVGAVSKPTPPAPTVPDDPSNLVATVLGANVQLTWSLGGGSPDDVQIERSTTGPSSGFSEIADIAATGSYVDTGALENQQAWYRVKTSNEQGSSGYSNTDDATVPVQAPTAFITTVSGANISMSWNDISGVETGYEIERSTTGPSSGFSLVHTTAAGAESWLDTAVLDDVEYWYRVRATTGSEQSGYSDSHSSTVPLQAPSALSATANGSDTIDLSWTDNSDNEDGFKIERSLTSGSGFSQIGTAGAGVTTYEDAGLDAETTYYYRVRAYKGATNSSYSSEASDTTEAEVTLPNPSGYYPCDESTDTANLLDGIGSFDITVTGSPDAQNTDKKFDALDYWRETTNGSYWRINNTTHESVWDYTHYTDGLWAMAGWVKPADSDDFLRIGYLSTDPFLELSNNGGVMRLSVAQDDSSVITADSTVTLTVDGSVWHGFLIQIKDDTIAISVDNETLVETSVGGGRTIGALDAGADIQIGIGMNGGWSNVAVWNGIELSAAQRTLWDDGHYWNGSLWVAG